MIITIIGLGLIGGSLGLSLRQNGFASQVLGVDNSDHHGQLAMELKLVDELVSIERGIMLADLIILATPVDQLAKLVPQVMDVIDQQVVMDVGSTKVHIMRSIEDHAKRSQFVGTHPMAGTEFSGPQAADINLFHGKCAVIVDQEKSDRHAIEVVENLYSSLNMRTVYHECHDHDMHSAYVSHISHISSFALALTVLEKEKNENRIFELAGGGFRSTVRLANSSPKTWIPIFEQNRDHVLDVLDEHINTISRFRTLLIKKDFDLFYKLIEQANQIKKIIK
jgi:prephenate dehydrogenase